MASHGLPNSQAVSSRLSQPPARRGLPEGKQPRSLQISLELLTEAACVCVEGPGTDFASQQAPQHACPGCPIRASPGRAGHTDLLGCRGKDGGSTLGLPSHCLTANPEVLEGLPQPCSLIFPFASQRLNCLLRTGHVGLGSFAPSSSLSSIEGKFSNRKAEQAKGGARDYSKGRCCDSEALAVSSDNYEGDPSRREGVWFLCGFILSVTQAR